MTVQVRLRTGRMEQYHVQDERIFELLKVLYRAPGHITTTALREFIQQEGYEEEVEVNKKEKWQTKESSICIHVTRCRLYLCPGRSPSRRRVQRHAEKFHGARGHFYERFGAEI